MASTKPLTRLVAVRLSSGSFLRSTRTFSPSQFAPLSVSPHNARSYATPSGPPPVGFRLPKPERWDQSKESALDKAGKYFLLTEMARGMYVVLEQYFRPPWVNWSLICCIRNWYATDILSIILLRRSATRYNYIGQELTKSRVPFRRGFEENMHWDGTHREKSAALLVSSVKLWVAFNILSNGCIDQLVDLPCSSNYDWGWGARRRKQTNDSIWYWHDEMHILWILSGELSSWCYRWVSKCRICNWDKGGVAIQ